MRLKLTSTELADMLRGGESARPKTLAPAARAEENSRRAIAALAQWGHLRCVELGRAVFPSARYPEQLAQRLVRKLISAGLVLARQNAVGSRSLVLTRRGAALAQALGLEGRHGLDLGSVSGATFIHRCLGTRYGIERQLEGAKVQGEHSLNSPALAVNREVLRRWLGKLPDLLVYRGQEVDWIEVESSAKVKTEIQRCLGISKHCGTFIPGTTLRLARLVFVCDGRLNHEARLRKAARELWPSNEVSAGDVWSGVYVAKVTLGPSAKWLSCTPAEPLRRTV